MPDEKYPNPTAPPEMVVKAASRELNDTEVLKQMFTYHAPSPYQQDIYEAIRTSALSLALTIHNSVPKCADRTAAIRKLREVVMTANAAVALHGLV